MTLTVTEPATSKIQSSIQNINTTTSTSTHTKIGQVTPLHTSNPPKTEQASSKWSSLTDAATAEKKPLNNTLITVTDISTDNIDSVIANWTDNLLKADSNAIILRYLELAEFTLVNPSLHDMGTLDDKISRLLQAFNPAQLQLVSNKLTHSYDHISNAGELVHKNLQTLVHTAEVEAQKTQFNNTLGELIEGLNNTQTKNIEQQYHKITLDAKKANLNDAQLTQAVTSQLDTLSKDQIESINDNIELSIKQNNNRSAYLTQLHECIKTVLFTKQDAFVNAQVNHFITNISTHSATLINDAYQNLLADTLFEIQESQYQETYAYEVINKKIQSQLLTLTSEELKSIEQRLKDNSDIYSVQPLLSQSITEREQLENQFNQKIDTLWQAWETEDIDVILTNYANTLAFTAQSNAFNQTDIDNALNDKLQSLERAPLITLMNKVRNANTNGLPQTKQDQIHALKQLSIKQVFVYASECKKIFHRLEQNNNINIGAHLKQLVNKMEQLGLTDIEHDLASIAQFYLQRNPLSIEKLTNIKKTLEQHIQVASANTVTQSNTSQLEGFLQGVSQHLVEKDTKVKQLDIEINSQINTLTEVMKNEKTNAIFPILTDIHHNINALSQIDPTIDADSELLRRFDKEIILWKREEIVSCLTSLFEFERNGVIPDENKHDFPLLNQRARQHFLTHSKKMDNLFSHINFNDPSDITQKDVIIKHVNGMTQLMKRVGFGDIQNQFSAITELYIQKNKLSDKQLSSLNQQLLNIVEHERTQQKIQRFSGLKMKNEDIEIETINMPLRAFARGVRNQILTKMATEFTDSTLNGPMTTLGNGAAHTVYKAQYGQNQAAQIKVYKQDDDRLSTSDGYHLLAPLIIGIDHSSPRLLERAVISSHIDQKLGFNVLVKTNFATHNEQLGLVMDKGSGTTASEAKFNPEYPRYKASLQQQLTQLHLVDIITGQMDRHAGNYMIDIDPKTDKIVVKGIDNDFCLGPDWNNLQLETRKFGSHLQHFPDVVDTEMKKAIDALTDKDIESLCAGLLSNAAIDATKLRLANLKSHLATLETKGRVIAPDTWGRYKTTKIMEQGEHTVYTAKTHDPMTRFTSYWARDVEMLEDNFAQYQNAANKYNYA